MDLNGTLGRLVRDAAAVEQKGLDNPLLCMEEELMEYGGLLLIAGILELLGFD